MMKRKLKKSIMYGLYASAFLATMGTIYVLEISTSKKFEDKTVFVNDTILDNYVPVVSVKDNIMRPYNTNNIKIVKNFYDYQAESENQENSLIYYDNTYLQNSGVDYSCDEEPFEVLAIHDGEVINVSENLLLGNIVEIQHKDGVISVYQSLGEVKVTLNEKVTQGQVIGISGVSNIDTKLGNHLHFELIVNGENVNPESYYGKKINEI